MTVIGMNDHRHFCFFSSQPTEKPCFKPMRMYNIRLLVFKQ